MSTGKTAALTMQTVVGKVMVLSVLSQFVIDFSSKECLLILCVQSPLVMILGPKKIKSVILSTFSFLFAMK